MLAGFDSPLRFTLNFEAMKIKLKRPLWNHKAGDEIEVGENFGIWAINRGYAVEVKDENKAVVPEYSKPTRGRKRNGTT